MIHMLKFALRDDIANNRAIGYYTAQQTAAYNAAVKILNGTSVPFRPEKPAEAATASALHNKLLRRLIRHRPCSKTGGRFSSIRAQKVIQPRYAASPSP